jgi:Flp pilus assembly protein TadD
MPLLGAFSPNSSSGRRASVLLGLIILFSYSNTFEASWHLDDYFNIVDNQLIQKGSSFCSSIAAPFAYLFESGHFNRPLALASFAANWYFGQTHVVGYHALNIAIHFAAAFILYLTVLLIFSTPRLKERYSPEQIAFFGLLTAALWALNPIQVQAVTYIVQRMASLCGMLYILSVYLYLKARLALAQKTLIVCFISSAVAAGAAALTKENAVTLPLALVLLEAAFFQDLGAKKVRLAFLFIPLLVLFLIAAAGVCVFADNDITAILDYSQRYFTWHERLLTQARVVFFYLSLIFYPVPTRLSIVHDVEISTSLFCPWTSLLSVLLILFIIGLSLFKLRKWPIASFPILFFFLNHSVESTVIPLEMVFEHRNYLPSMFLFMPVAFAIERLIFFYRSKSPLVHHGLLVFACLLLVGYGTGTYVRNMAWTTEFSLWTDAVQKAPRSARPYATLAWAYYGRTDDRATALRLYHTALELRKDSVSEHAKIWSNIANIYYLGGDCERAAYYWGKSQDLSSSLYMPRFLMAMALTRCGRTDEALVKLESVLAQNPDFARALNLKGVNLLMQEKPVEALSALRQCLRKDPQNGNYLVNIGAAYHMMGNVRKAGLFLAEGLKRTDREQISLLWLIDHCLEKGDEQSADIYARELVSKLPSDKLALWLKVGFSAKFYRSEVIFPKSDEKLIRFLAQRYLDSYNQFEGLAGHFSSTPKIADMSFKR